MLECLGKISTPDLSASCVDRQGMLLVLPVPFRLDEADRLFFEFQACNGIEKWADQFGKVVVVAPLLPEEIVARERTIVWRDTASLSQPERFELVPVPWAYTLKKFLYHYQTMHKALSGLIDRCQYLQFPLGGLFGDWGAVAALTAHQQGRRYAIHTDWVEDQVILQLAQDKSCLKRLKGFILSGLAKHYYQWIIQRSTLALLHGEDCYAAYHRFCPHSFLVHDTHTKPEDTIDDEALTKKLKTVASDRTLRICYTGRMACMKAPLDWVRAIGKARELGVEIQATWLGDGDLREDMQQLIYDLRLEGCIELAGYERDRQKVLKRIQDAHLMLFTHITPESPRCLVEALVSGTAIAGYYSRYAEDLTKQGGGVLVPIRDWQRLGELLQELWCDRPRLAQLIQQSADQRFHFNDEAVFRERSELIKQHLS
jgi:glycosyltransferase involved in cell wall biosynthesis